MPRPDATATASDGEQVLAALLDDLDVVTASALALEPGGEAARTLLAVLRLAT